MLTMKNKGVFILLLLAVFSCQKTPIGKNPPGHQDTSQLKDYHKDLTIVNWNIEWFGSTQFGNDLDAQEANAGKILKYLAADLYGICEVVDTTRFGRMVRNNLGNEFRYTIATYIQEPQKFAFIYNRNIFRNVKVRPFMGISTEAYINFARRYPYLFTAEVTVNSSKNTVSFILIHAKANADLESYNRRLNGAVEMKDSLDQYFKGKNFMVLGDYNDNFNGSILDGKPSPYQNFLNDHTGYTAITYPLNAPGYQSTITYANSVIDQQIISANMVKWYVGSSVKIRTDVTVPVPDYNSRSTSDHYPVSSLYRFSNQ